MLQSLHVKNLALMEDTEVEFGSGLNILTGETGAGKSLLIGSINLALGGKFEKEMLRKDADSAIVELVFSTDERVNKKLEEMGLETLDESVLLSRKMQVGKSVCRINGEIVTAKQVKELSELLIDIHGQNEHQSLLHKKKHLEILDAYCGEELYETANKVTAAYQKCRELRKKLDEEAMDEATRRREQSLAEFEWQEIEAARLVPGEDEELEAEYRRMTNSRKITEYLSESYRLTGSDSSEGAGNTLSHALRAVRNISSYDNELMKLEEQLTEIDNLLADYNRDLAEYLNRCEFDSSDFARVEERLNTLNRLKGKYGNTIEEVIQYGEKRQIFLSKLSDYDNYIRQMASELEAGERDLEKACKSLSRIRQKHAAELQEKLKAALINLNCLTVEFEISVRPEQVITANGYDDVEFMISTNPGEARKPLHQIASGGELSRIMLAIKTVLAGEDQTDTLIFDEIDAGISGRTAWKVSEQLDIVATAHQVICITHLPQIAAMADRHFCIEKSSDGEHTRTDIRILREEESMKELSRLLGSDAFSEAALSNAREMRSQAVAHKEKIRCMK